MNKSTTAGSAMTPPSLGKLRANLLLFITNGQKRVPEPDEIRRWILDQYSIHPITADTYRSLLLAREDLVLSEGDIPALPEALATIDRLEALPLPLHSFVTFARYGRTTGVLVHREELEVGGDVYAITLFRGDGDLSKVGRLELRICSHTPEPFLSIFTPQGWSRLGRAEIPSTGPIADVLGCIAARHHFHHRNIPIDKISDGRPDLVPPTNEAQMRLIRDAYRDKIACTRAWVPLHRIDAEDDEFALNMDPDVVKSAMRIVAEHGKPHLDLLLYEQDGRLLSGDDYPIYLAYRALLFKEVPAVIMGDFDETEIRVVKRGFSELMPPVVLSREEPLNVPSLTTRDLLERKLRDLSPAPSGAADRLEQLYIAFSRLLGSERTIELDLHQFICRHPMLVDGHMASLSSEVRIGRYRADLVIRYEQSDKRICLVELERHSDRIFKRKNRLQHKVNHATQQVEDWIAAIRQRVKPIPDWLDDSYVPEGLVVIGRRRDLSKDEQDALFQINTNRLVKIITYDDLLERLRRLIDQIRTAER